MLQQFFEMKTFTPSTSKSTLSFSWHFKLGNTGSCHKHLLSIFWNFYYDATKLLQTDNCVKISLGGLVKLKWFASVLSERVSLNDYIPLVEYVFIARHIWYSQVIRLCQLVSNPDKKLPDKPKLHCRNFLQTGAVARFINIWLGVYPADSRKACCEVCNNTVQILAKHVNFKVMLVAKAPRQDQRTFCMLPNVNSTKFWATKTRLRELVA